MLSASLVENAAMSISPLGAVSGTLAPSNAAATSGFLPHFAAAMGRSHAGSSHRIQETGAIGAPPAHGMADDTRALFGDAFGTLGAVSGTATPRQAAAAYARAS
jgi:hypothetical protein